MNRAVSTFNRDDPELVGISPLDDQVRRYKRKSVNRPSMEKGTAPGVDGAVSGFRSEASGFGSIRNAAKTGATGVKNLMTRKKPPPAVDPTQDWSS